MYRNDTKSYIAFIQHVYGIEPKRMTAEYREPTSELLDYCQNKFLRPYVKIFAIVGLNPIAIDATPYQVCVNYIQAIIVLILLLLGYIFRYLCNYRSDRGFERLPAWQTGNSIACLDFSNSTTTTTTSRATSMEQPIGDLIFNFTIPCCLHMFGFVSAVFLYKIIDNEHLENLTERVFLMVSKPKELCRILWIYLSLGFVLLIVHFTYACCFVLMQPLQDIRINWLANGRIYMKIILLLTIFLQYLVEMIIYSGYYIQCYMLRVHLVTLSHKLHMHTIDCLDWMRQMLEFRKLLERVNHRVAVPVSFLTIMNLTYAFAGLVHLFQDFTAFPDCAMTVFTLNLINVLLCFFLGLLPFFVAASVTRACQAAQGSGHRIRVKPFVYQYTSIEDLNSTLLFASSMVMSAKLFRMPVQSSYLCFIILVITIITLTLGMCLKLSSLGTTF